ncbi:uncharacterized protein METZ01_LOCUS69648, partial [marine metagenome]
MAISVEILPHRSKCSSTYPLCFYISLCDKNISPHPGIFDGLFYSFFIVSRFRHHVSKLAEPIDSCFIVLDVHHERSTGSRHFQRRVNTRASAYYWWVRLLVNIRPQLRKGKIPVFALVFIVITCPDLEQDFLGFQKSLLGLCRVYAKTSVFIEVESRSSA